MTREEVYERVNKLGTRVALLKEEIATRQKEQASIERELEGLKEELTRLNNEVPRVTDHALVRYMERAYGFDMGKLRDEILTRERIGAINAGASRIKVNGLTFRIANKAVVTIVD